MGRFLVEPTEVAASPDGRFVYVVSSGSPSENPEGGENHGTIAIFARDPLTGALAQLPGSSGCVGENGVDGAGGTCTEGHGLHGVDALAISPDGNNLYVGSSGLSKVEGEAVHAVASFTRDQATGQLTQAAGTAGCLTDDATLEPDCAAISGPLKELHSLVVSPDGKNVYAAVSQDTTPENNGAILELSRNTSTGALTQPGGAAGCIANTLAAGCAQGRALREPYGITFAPGGDQLYVAASEGVPTPGDNDGAVVLLERNASTGVLSQPAGAAGCINATGKDQSETPGTCATITTGSSLHDANSVVVSPDGANVYVAAQGTVGSAPLGYGALNAFARDKTGRLSQLAGLSGCVSQDGSDGNGAASKCAVGRAMFEPTGVAISPDGGDVYLASSDTPASLDTFARNRETGSVSQLAGTEGCVSVAGSDGSGTTCTVGLGMGGASDIAVVATGACRNVYVTTQDASALTSFTLNPLCPLPTATTPATTTTTTSTTPPAAPPAAVAPVLTALKISPTSFPAASSGASISAVRKAKRRRGAFVTYRDSQAAVTSFTVQKMVAGVRSRGKCVEAPRKPARNAKRCSLVLTVGRFTRPDVAGSNRLHFSGRVARAKLRPGHYRLTAQSRNAARLSSKTLTAAFVVTR